MIKKFAGIVTILLLAGVLLTLYLPTYQPAHHPIVNQPYYQVDLPSLKSPLPLSDTLIPILPEDNDLYGLSLGLFGQLPHAIQQGKKYALKDSPYIIKTTDDQRYWYILIIGPFDDKVAANQKSVLLLQNKNISTKLIKWPLNSDKLASADKVTG